MRTQGGPPTHAELEDLELVLRQRGVAPVSDSAAAWLREKHGASSSVGLLTLVASFRTDRSARKALQDKGYSRGKRGKKEQEHISISVTKQLLMEHGYTDEKIEEALMACGADVQRCVEHCLREAADDAMVEDEVVAAETWASDVITQLGFDTAAATNALEQMAFSFPDALVLLLNGNDVRRHRFVGTARFHRQTHKSKVASIPVRSDQADADRRSEYKRRAANDLHKQVEVVDLGQHAGATTGACFWLSLAAGLSRGRWRIDSQAWPGLADAAPLLAQVRAMDLAALMKLNKAPATAVRKTPLGLFAERLRRYMCADPDAVLLRRDIKEKLYAAFAALGGRGERTLQQYIAWVGKLSTREYADELVVLAVALEFKIKIVCVPHTPTEAIDRWTVSQYQPPGVDLAEELTVVLGNNDLHYVWLAGV